MCVIWFIYFFVVCRYSYISYHTIKIWININFLLALWLRRIFLNVLCVSPNEHVSWKSHFYLLTISHLIWRNKHNASTLNLIAWRKKKCQLHLHRSRSNLTKPWIITNQRASVVSKMVCNSLLDRDHQKR